MKLGIKVGPQPDSINDLTRARPDAAEVWFNIHRAQEYDALFTKLKASGIKTGLHYWGALADGTWTNLAYPDTQLVNRSKALMQETIDIAAQNGFVYVNIHPGTRAKVAINFEHESFKLLSEPIDLDRSTRLFLEHAHELSEYAIRRGVTLTIETVPARVSTGWYDQSARQNPLNIYELPVSVIVECANQGLYVANDFCHTASNVIADTPEPVWDFLAATTEAIAPQTRLIHLGFIVPPYNGTDNHDMLNNPLLDTNKAIPNRKQMIELLRIFKNRNDVIVITEPKTDHVGNFFLAKAIVERANT